MNLCVMISLTLQPIGVFEQFFCAVGTAGEVCAPPKEYGNKILIHHMPLRPTLEARHLSIVLKSARGVQVSSAYPYCSTRHV